MNTIKHLRELPSYAIYEDLHWENPKSSPLPTHQFSPHAAHIRFGTMNFELLPFENREQYITWRRIWRDAYRAISQQIRHYKQLLRNKPHDPNTAPDLQYQLHHFRRTAHEMMAQRIKSKLKAKYPLAQATPA